MLAHAAWIASDLPAGELFCPIAVVEIGDSREVIPFEAVTQEEAIRLDKQKVAELTGAVDRWAFAREGLWSRLSSDTPKLDVLSVTAWSNGLDEPLILQQCFSHIRIPSLLAPHGDQGMSRLELGEAAAVATEGSVRITGTGSGRNRVPLPGSWVHAAQPHRGFYTALYGAASSLSEGAVRTVSHYSPVEEAVRLGLGECLQ